MTTVFILVGTIFAIRQAYVLLYHSRQKVVGYSRCHHLSVQPLYYLYSYRPHEPLPYYPPHSHQDHVPLVVLIFK